MVNPKLDITPYAVNLADQVGSLFHLVAKANEEMDELRESGGLDNLLTIYFHTFSYEGEEFIIWPGEGVMRLDACTRKDYVASTGPAAGSPVSIPAPRSSLS